MTEATIDLRRHGEIQAGRIDPRVRTPMLTMLGVGAGLAAIGAISLTGAVKLHVLAALVVANAIVLLTLIAFISQSTRTAVGQLRREIVADVVAQVSAVVASRVVNMLQDEVARMVEAARARQHAAFRGLAEHQNGLANDITEHQGLLTKELARMRGQVNIGLRDLAEAVERVEACVKADITVAYDLGAQSTRD